MPSCAVHCSALSMSDVLSQKIRDLLNLVVSLFGTLAHVSFSSCFKSCWLWGAHFLWIFPISGFCRYASNQGCGPSKRALILALL